MKARYISVLALALVVAAATSTAPSIAHAADGGGGGGGGGDGGAGFTSDGPAASRQAITAYWSAVKAVKAADYATAISLLNGVVAEYPDNANAYNYLGYAHRKQNKFKAAFRHYSKALELNPKHVGAN